MSHIFLLSVFGGQPIEGEKRLEADHHLFKFTPSMGYPRQIGGLKVSTQMSADQFFRVY
ncbi:MAG TPA: hypothetical protein HA306_00380 [Methanosarcina sp.]|nr:hypothetical protein [Methanosarcina sp.]